MELRRKNCSLRPAAIAANIVQLTSKADIAWILGSYLPDLKYYEKIYQQIHSHPELSGNEIQTATLAASHLRSLGFDPVHTQIGGTGVAGVLRNGPGSTVLLRADMDALPVEEETGLPYASHITAMEKDGIRHPVMHACGHDMHVTCLMGAADLLMNAKDSWSGNLICIFQPDEERGGGAERMVADGLYSKVPKPDMVLGQHVTPVAAGFVCTGQGPSFSAADSLHVLIHGRGGHGSEPDTTIDPIVTGAHIITRLQSIISREVHPGKLAILSIGSVHAGESENVIPDTLEMRINIRTFEEKVRAQVLAAVRRIIEAECVAAGMEKKPEIKVTSSFPVTDNDAELTEKITKTFKDFFGEKKVWPMGRIGGSEDVSRLATAIGVPYSYWIFGGSQEKIFEEAWKEGKVNTMLPSNHSGRFAPVLEPTIKTGIQALSAASLTFLVGKEEV